MPTKPLRCYRVPTPFRVSFSGGRTSGFLLWNILQAYEGKLPEGGYVVFANTGKEVEETLEFVRDCEANWGVPITWVEYCRFPNRPVVMPNNRKQIGCHGFKRVTFKTASRQGQPFADLINVKAEYRKAIGTGEWILPNPVQRWCSGQLKARTMERLMRKLRVKDHTVAVGLRSDERSRVMALEANSTDDVQYVCPLADAGVVEADVLAFWQEQPFDLKLKADPEFGTYAGNCDGCFLKRKAKLLRMEQERPGSLDWWAQFEERSGANFRRDREPYRELQEIAVGTRVGLPLCPDEPELGLCLCND